MDAPGIITGGEVRLRPWRPTDAPAVNAVRDDPVVARWSSLPRDRAANWIMRQMHKPDGVSLAVAWPTDDHAIGKVALGHHDPAAHQAELSYWMVPEARRRGLAQAACRTLIRWGFEVTHLDSIVLDIEVDDLASQAVARRLGAKRPDGPPRLEADCAGVPRELELWYLNRRI